MTLSQIVVVLLGLLAGVIAGFILRKKLVETRQQNLEEQGRKIIENALDEAEKIKRDAELQAKDEGIRLKQEAEEDIKELKASFISEEKRLMQKSEQIDRKIDLLDKREFELLNKEKAAVEEEKKIADLHSQADLLVEQQRNQLEKISGISQEEARQQLTESIESEARMEAAKGIVRIENEMKIEADRKAKNILGLAIARYAGEYVAEKTVSVVPLPNDEMKGRIIGREGRNIRAIEAATGIDVIIDDTPEAVILSGFNPVRREVARQ